MSEEFRLNKWLSDGVEGVKSTLQGSGGSLLPEDFRTHLKTSRKETPPSKRSTPRKRQRGVAQPKSRSSKQQSRPSA
jgi:hypothetical protein